jgi:hypothetical protein
VKVTFEATPDSAGAAEFTLDSNAERAPEPVRLEFRVT